MATRDEMKPEPDINPVKSTVKDTVVDELPRIRELPLLPVELHRELDRVMDETKLAEVICDNIKQGLK